MRLSVHSQGSLKVVHVPKTIDNDLDLPAWIPTFGYQTARHVGTGIVRDLLTDAQTTSRWYFVVAMGRKAGHLALGIGKAAGATLTVIPEEFPGKQIPMRQIVDVLTGAIIKRRTEEDTQGLTTAAGIWMTAAIGVACGLGRETTALLSALLALAVLALLPRLVGREQR